METSNYTIFLNVLGPLDEDYRVVVPGDDQSDELVKSCTSLTILGDAHLNVDTI